MACWRGHLCLPGIIPHLCPLPSLTGWALGKSLSCLLPPSLLWLIFNPCTWPCGLWYVAHFLPCLGAISGNQGGLYPPLFHLSLELGSQFTLSPKNHFTPCPLRGLAPLHTHTPCLPKHAPKQEAYISCTYMAAWQGTVPGRNLVRTCACIFCKHCIVPSCRSLWHKLSRKEDCISPSLLKKALCSAVFFVNKWRDDHYSWIIHSFG